MDSSSRQRAITVVDLFAGAGGLSEGFRQAGFRILGGVDSDPDAAATYRLNFPEASTISGDVRDEAIREQLTDVLKSAQVIVGGPPCQAFSQLRNHSRVIEDPRNRLYREFVGAIRFAMPVAFVMENVTGIDQMGVREQIARDLALDGEYLVRPQILDAADFGVPQTRKRLLFVGIRARMGQTLPMLQGSGATACLALERRAAASGSSYALNVQENVFGRSVGRAARDREDDSVVTAADAISDLVVLPTGNRSDEVRYSSLPSPQTAFQRNMRESAGSMLSNVQVPRINADTALRLRGIPPGGNHRDLPDELLERYITGQKWGQDNGSGRLSRRHFYAYRRLHPDIWAWTLNTKADSVYHYEVPRGLSVREFARLQSFPDRFVFTSDPRKGPLPGRHDGGPAHSRYRQVGNAVPPLLARAVAVAVRQALDEPVRLSSPGARAS